MIDPLDLAADRRKTGPIDSLGMAMLVMSIAIVLAYVAAFMASDRTVCSTPISMLIYGRHGGFYYAIIALIAASVGIYAGRLRQRGRMVDYGIAASACMLFMLLIAVNNDVQPAHGILASAAIGLVTWLGIAIW